MTPGWELSRCSNHARSQARERGIWKSSEVLAVECSNRQSGGIVRSVETPDNLELNATDSSILSLQKQLLFVDYTAQSDSKAATTRRVGYLFWSRRGRRRGVNKSALRTEGREQRRAEGTCSSSSGRRSRGTSESLPGGNLRGIFLLFASSQRRKGGWLFLASAGRATSVRWEAREREKGKEGKREMPSRRYQ